MLVNLTGNEPFTPGDAFTLLDGACAHLLHAANPSRATFGGHWNSMADCDIGCRMLKQVIHFSTNEWKNCPVCGQLNVNAELDECINHFLGHGYTLLHVGQETIRDSDGKPWQTTAVVMGK